MIVFDADWLAWGQHTPATSDRRDFDRDHIDLFESRELSGLNLQRGGSLDGFFSGCDDSTQNCDFDVPCLFSLLTELRGDCTRPRRQIAVISIVCALFR